MISCQLWVKVTPITRKECHIDKKKAERWVQFIRQKGCSLYYHMILRWNLFWSFKVDYLSLWWMHEGVCSITYTQDQRNMHLIKWVCIYWNEYVCDHMGIWLLKMSMDLFKWVYIYQMSVFSQMSMYLIIWDVSSNEYIYFQMTMKLKFFTNE